MFLDGDFVGAVLTCPVPVAEAMANGKTRGLFSRCFGAGRSVSRLPSRCLTMNDLYRGKAGGRDGKGVRLGWQGYRRGEEDRLWLDRGFPPLASPTAPPQAEVVD